MTTYELLTYIGVTCCVGGVLVGVLFAVAGCMLSSMISSNRGEP